jgi:hypothetical protein
MSEAHGHGHGGGHGHGHGHGGESGEGFVIFDAAEKAVETATDVEHMTNEGADLIMETLGVMTSGAVKAVEENAKGFTTLGIEPVKGHGGGGHGHGGGHGGHH